MIRIDACLIIKNEPYCQELIENQLTKFCDNIYIIDTGSTDNTYNILKEIESRNSNIHIFNDYIWKDNFGEARNYSFSKSKNADYIFWCDGDDYLPNELINRLIQFHNENIDKLTCEMYKIPYLYSKNEMYTSLRLVRTNSNIIWKSRIHEYLEKININDPCTIDDNYFKNTYVEHKYYDIKNINRNERNFGILKLIEKNRENFIGSNLGYYGLSLYHNNYLLLAHKIFEELILGDLKNNYCNVDKLYGAYYCELIESEYPKFNFAIKYNELYEHLYNQNIKRSDIVCHLGIYYFKKNFYSKAINFFKESINLGYPNDFFDFEFHDRYSMNLKPFYYLTICFYKIKQYNISLYYNKLATEFIKNNNLKQQLDFDINQIINELKDLQNKCSKYI